MHSHVLKGHCPSYHHLWRSVYCYCFGSCLFSGWVCKKKNSNGFYFQTMGNLGSSDVDSRLEEQLIDGILYAFQEQTQEVITCLFVCLFVLFFVFCFLFFVLFCFVLFFVFSLQEWPLHTLSIAFRYSVKKGNENFKNINQLSCSLRAGARYKCFGTTASSPAGNYEASEVCKRSNTENEHY